MAFDRAVYTVTDVNKYIKNVINNDQNLKYIFVKGEISNYKNGANGHVYFSLKDKDSIISVCLFSTYASKLTFAPKNGDEVIVLASVDVYPSRGSYQLITVSVEQVGQGKILIELEELKKKLAAEGLFDQSRKRELNLFPSSIGIITAENSAAIKDILFNIKRRYPIADLYFFPCQVQGENAPKDLLRAFNLSQQYNLDTIIIGRGGGASEDLAAFNDETLVRALAKSNAPIISAVGHEIDSTLVDFVADKRASTPTGAAELATIDRREIEVHFEDCLESMRFVLENYVSKQAERISFSKDKISSAISEKITILKQKIALRKEQIQSLSPKKILSRGYTITTNSKGQVITKIDEINVNDEITTTYSDGKIKSKVTTIERE